MVLSIRFWWVKLFNFQRTLARKNGRLGRTCGKHNDYTSNSKYINSIYMYILYIERDQLWVFFSLNTTSNGTRLNKARRYNLHEYGEGERERSADVTKSRLCACLVCMWALQRGPHISFTYPKLKIAQIYLLQNLHNLKAAAIHK